MLSSRNSLLKTAMQWDSARSYTPTHKPLTSIKFLGATVMDFIISKLDSLGVLLKLISWAEGERSVFWASSTRSGSLCVCVCVCVWVCKWSMCACWSLMYHNVANKIVGVSLKIAFITSATWHRTIYISIIYATLPCKSRQNGCSPQLTPANIFLAIRKDAKS